MAGVLEPDDPQGPFQAKAFHDFIILSLTFIVLLLLNFTKNKTDSYYGLFLVTNVVI